MKGVGSDGQRGVNETKEVESTRSLRTVAEKTNQRFPRYEYDAYTDAFDASRLISRRPRRGLISSRRASSRASR